MTALHRVLQPAIPEKRAGVLLEREWLVTNGLGGYASGTISDACTRRYHGLLIAALSAPLGRYVMFNQLAEGPRASLVCDGGFLRHVQYRAERARGYENEGILWSPGYFRADMAEGDTATLMASVEDWDTIRAVEPGAALTAELQRRERLISQARPEVQRGWAAEFVLAADQFIVRPATRLADIAKAHAAGDDVRTAIAGYHWFTDWGRDTMISLEGLTLVTGRQNEAGYLLRTFGRYVRDGLMAQTSPHNGI